MEDGKPDPNYGYHRWFLVGEILGGLGSVYSSYRLGSRSLPLSEPDIGEGV